MQREHSLCFKMSTILLWFQNDKIESISYDADDESKTMNIPWFVVWRPWWSLIMMTAMLPDWVHLPLEMSNCRYQVLLFWTSCTTQIHWYVTGKAQIQHLQSNFHGFVLYMMSKIEELDICSWTMLLQSFVFTSVLIIKSHNNHVDGTKFQQ